MRQSQNKLPRRACAPRGGLAVAAVTASIAAQPASVPLVDANFASFVEHPTHCASLLDGRAGIVLDAKSCSKKQDDVALLLIVHFLLELVTTMFAGLSLPH